MKKRYIFIVISLLFLATYTAFAGKASSYTISQNGISTEYSYTDWPALMAQVKTYNGTSSARVTVTITGNDFDEADKMPKVENYNTIVCANDVVPYTTFKFDNCTFVPSVDDEAKYDCISFGYAIAPGIVLEFHDCTLNERLYGNEAGTQGGTHYTVDAKFYGCTFTSAATGGRHFGDLLFDGCRFTNRVSWDNTEPVINAQNATEASQCKRENSVGGESTLTVKDCTFDQPITDASWLRFIYARDFQYYDIDIDYDFYPCLSDKFNFDKVSDYNTDKLETGRVKKLVNLPNNATSSSKINFLAFVPARVKYDANAPESASASGETKDDNMYEAGENFTVKTNGFTCKGYKFIGWNTLANPTEAKPGTAYTEGQTAQIPLTIGFKLYAQWEELGPFLVVRTDTQYPTLQQAVDAAQSGDVIEVLPCADFGVDEYDMSYATNIAANRVPVGTANYVAGGQVFVADKSLTFQNHDDLNSAILKDFVIVLEASANFRDYTFDKLNFTGVSMIIPANQGGSDQGFGQIEVKNCYGDVSGKTYGLKLKPYNSIETSMGNTWSSGNFLISPLYGSGTANMNKLLFHDNQIIGRIQGYQVRIISGSMKSKYSEVYGNTFGSPEAMTTSVAFIEQVTLDNGYYSVHDNVIYGVTDDVEVLWLCSTGGASNNTQAVAYNNNVYTPDNARPFYIKDNVPKTYYDIIYYNSKNEVSGTATAYHNYINGYCFNECYNGGSGTMDKKIQDGHTYGDGHIKSISESDNALIKKYGIKAEDIYQLNKSDAFTGGDHDKHTLSSDQYCDRCDDILTALIITCTGLSENESAIFTVKDADANEVCTLSLTGPDAKKAVIGLKAGEYTVSADSWDWTYTNPASVTKDVKYLNSVSSQDDITFPFELTKKSGVTVKHGEDSKLNELTK